MTPTYTSQDTDDISKKFISASNLLASGIAKEAMNDINRFLRYGGHCMLELWLDASYSTAIYLEDLKEKWL